MYTRPQCRMIAREVLRAGRVLTRAAKALREDYESFPAITHATIRRLMRKPYFPEILREQEEILAKAIPEGESAAERSRARLEAGGGQLSRKIVLAAVRRIRDGAFDAEDNRELKFKQLSLLLGFIKESSAL
jgi:hypothetical protein